MASVASEKWSPADAGYPRRPRALPGAPPTPGPARARDSRQQAPLFPPEPVSTHHRFPSQDVSPDTRLSFNPLLLVTPLNCSG